MKYTYLLLMLSCSTLIRVEGQTVRASRALRPSVVAPVVLGPTGFWQLMRVRRVVDADTYEVDSPMGAVARVRLLGVDAPESSQPYGRQAMEQVAALVQGRLVWVRLLGGDAYGRNLVAVKLRPAAFETRPAVALDSLLVVRGWAWAYDPGHVVAGRAAEQQQAQAARRGLWKCGLAAPVRPGVWRAFNKQEKARAWVGCPGF
ncbi:Endonuclease YncB, thermonuclease family [Hymenobacter psychrophilus]|uniref:Endonuclease YncB, thermonuclease family n=2 Tax=Hymenobacter psychrophilus TaxID=651662 RepID=A0A1H3KY45_9BACT|nr:Endonuclease YncB, thermonuclease family [Hymenobacter psychrophilus]